jgi:hypothetical protein
MQYYFVELTPYGSCRAFLKQPVDSKLAQRISAASAWCGPDKVTDSTMSWEFSLSDREKVKNMLDNELGLRRVSYHEFWPEDITDEHN